ncbi:hypothetical protein GCM10009547_13270 [Sporichthya brevicatena]|uniref:Uncharacterized protein n=1 Tax=Sporichthya brevicatena TaxID=171442 RepID=A0ABN1GJ33_9ACTN
MVTHVQPSDDYFHRDTMSADPFWNESAWFPFYVAERDLSGFVYMNHRPNMNFSMTGVALWDPSGENMWDCIYHDWHEFAPLDLQSDTEMFDYTTPNGLSVSCLEPLKAFSLQYDRDGVRFDLRFDATMDVANSGFPDGSEEWGPHHYEQGGRITGTVEVNNEEIAVDCGSNRDHSWGPRLYKDNPRGDFPWFNDGKGFALQMYNASDLPRDTDPITGTTEKAITGWIQRDGKVANIVQGSRTVLERRADGVPWRLAIEGIDELGRTVRAEGRCKNVLKWVPWARYLQFWSLCEWTLDDGSVQYGEAIEWFPGIQARKFLRSIPVEKRTYR